MRRRGREKPDGTGGQDEHALGRSKGGFGTTGHGRFDGLGHPRTRLLTAASASDIAPAEARRADHRPEVVIADTGYDKRARVADIEARGAEAVIPALRNRAVQRTVGPHPYRGRNLCARFGSKPKPSRRVATRYDKTAANYLAFVQVAAHMVMRK